ncbi:MAG TPA: type II toxin-antitoxin system prevent-host-death family antitoxin [Gemmatimonadota bacterium]|nr:type II toxin-antitoxin system prevent-host-death family antitoxin [Gemmatimonadota bacterium]
MTIRTSYTQARANLAKLLDRVTRDRETVIIERRGAQEVALISAEELAGLEETAHLLRSPKNAERLLAALTRALGKTVEPSSVEDVRRELGLEPAEPT